MASFIPRIRLQPRQGELYRLMKTGVATNLGVGGARGGAKSGGARRVMLLRRFDYPGTVGMIFRRTYPELLDNHILPMWREFPALESGYNKGEKNLTLPNGSIISFRYGENMAAIESFLGKEFQDIVVDQAEALTELERQYLKSCCRWTGIPDNQCKFIETFNPGGRGSGHLKRLYKLKAFRPEEEPEDYAFIPARGWDNIEWVRPYLERTGVSEKTYYRGWTDPQRKECFLKHSSYGRTMAALPPGLRAGWLEGDFDSFSGQYFENFTEATHVVDDAEMHWRPWFKRWIAIDWGYHHNAAVGWFTQAYRGDDTARPLYWQYRELVKNKMDSAELAERVADLSEGEEIDAVYMGSDAKSTRDAGGDTPHGRMSQVFRKRGLPMIADANRDRISGWRLMHELFGRLPSEENPGEPTQVVLSRSCQRTAATISLMSVDKARPEDCEKFDSNEEGDGGDDACLTAGTLVLTASGLKRIEKVRRGDKVMTRKGLRRVLWSGMTARSAEVFTVCLSTGEELTGTRAHGVLAGGKWKQLRELKAGDELEPWINRKQSSFRGGNILFGADTTGLPSDFSTATFGARRTDLFRRATTSIIGMVTASITAWKTWSASRRERIFRHTAGRDRQPSETRQEKEPRGGTRAMPGESGTGGTPLKSGLTSPRGMKWIATSAANHSPGPRARSSAPTPASRRGGGRRDLTTYQAPASTAAGSSAGIGTTERVFVATAAPRSAGEKKPVYNLQVEGEPEFYANGVLVHNCDMHRYGLLSRLRPGKKPQEVEMGEKLAGIEDMTEKSMIHRRLLAQAKKKLRTFRLR